MSTHGGKREGAGRPPVAEKKTNVQAQFGRRPKEDVDMIDEAAKLTGKTRAAWAWPILLAAARKELGKGKNDN